MKRVQKISVIFVGALALSSVAQAREGANQYNNGAENWGVGAVPPEGYYFVNYAGYYSGTLKDPQGDNLMVGGKKAKVSAVFDALRFVRVTNIKVLGGDFGVQAIIPLVHQTLDFPGIGQKGTATGLGDMVVTPAFVGWHKGNWHHVAGIDVLLPTGKYDKSTPFKNIGANYFSFEPVYAVSYLNDKGLDVSAKFMYNIKTKNTDTDYQSGDEVRVDALVGKKFGKVQLGLAGYYNKQVTADKANGVPVANSKNEVLALGPSLKYTFADHSMLVAAYEHEVIAKNTFGGDKFHLKYIMRF
jgi:hypothetical protein